MSMHIVFVLFQIIVYKRNTLNVSRTTMALPLQSCSSMCLAGASGSGKTTFVHNLLRNVGDMYRDEPPQAILYCYGIYQSLFAQMEKEIPGFLLHQGLPSQSEIDDFTANGAHNLIILDDLMNQVTRNEDMELLFTRDCHHKRLSAIFITQNMFEQGKNARSINLNTWYLVLFKNIRGTSQISTLGSQCFPGQKGMLMAVYQDCMKEPFGYLFLDLSPSGEQKYRMRSHIFPNEDPVIYVPKNL